MSYRNDTLEARWELALQRVFPNGIPSSTRWTTPQSIAAALSDLAAPNSGHMFFPSGGGDDLVVAQLSPRSSDMIDLFTDEEKSSPYVMRPAQLSFTCPSGYLPMAHFVLENRAISARAEFPASSDEYREEFAQAPNGKTFSLGQWDNDDDGSGNGLPSGTHRVMRYWNGGSIAIFAKSSPYNQSGNSAFDAYDAIHLQPEFPSIVAALTKRHSAG